MNSGRCALDVARTRESPNTPDSHNQLGPSPWRSPTIAYVPVRRFAVPIDTNPFASRSTRSFHSAQPPPARTTTARTQMMLPATSDAIRRCPVPDAAWLVGPTVCCVVMKSTTFGRLLTSKSVRRGGRAGIGEPPYVSHAFREGLLALPGAPGRARVKGATLIGGRHVMGAAEIADAVVGREAELDAVAQ